MIDAAPGPRLRASAALLLALGLLLAAAGQAQDQAQASADDRAAQVKAMLEQLFSGVFAIAQSSAPGMQKRDAIESRLAGVLDYSTLARAALGQSADRFSREEYADFAHEYGRYVTFLLTQRIADAEEPAELVEVRADPEKPIVRALALGRERRRIFMFQRNQTSGRSELRMVLRPVHGDWRVAGLAIDAIDITKMFRDQFESVLGRSEPEALIEDLQRRNRDNDGVDPFAPAKK